MSFFEGEECLFPVGNWFHVEQLQSVTCVGVSDSLQDAPSWEKVHR